jgi:periplasmic protein CpxP/Spy
MKMIKAAFLLFAMMSTLGAYAWQSPAGQENQGRGPMNVDDRVKMLADRLNLNDDQQAKVKSILTDSQKQGQSIRDDNSLSQEDRRDKMRSLRESTNSKIREVLNDDQKKKFDEMQQQMRDRAREGKGGN